MLYNQNSFDEELKKATGKRLNYLFVLVFVALAVLIVRLSFVQLAQGSLYLQRAETNRYIQQSVPAPRGQIYDRDHNLLVTNKPSFAVLYTILSKDVQDPQKISSMLAPVLHKTSDEILNTMDLKGQHYMLSMARRLFTNAGDEQVAYIKEHQADLPGVNVVVEPIRHYERNSFACHVLGYLNNIPGDFWEQHKDEYQQTDLIGMAGVEREYEKYLRGKAGKLQVEVNIYNQPLQDQRLVEPIKGHDLVLTLNSNLQAATEQALAERVQNLKRTVRTVQNGAAIAMDPKTGEILAMASYPSYDPNIWIKGVTEKEYQEQFAPAEMNRSLQQLYQPGSTVKMATELIGFKEGVIKPGSVIYDPGRIQVGYLPNGKPNYIKSWKTIGYADSYRALAESSNVYMIRSFLNLAGYREDMPTAQVNDFLKNRLPNTMDKIENYHKEFGMGPTTTDVDLPYEAEGQITREGYVSDLAFSAIGQTENYTVMQLAQYVSTIANDGKRMKPHVVKEIVPPGGTSESIPVVQQGQLSFAPEHLRAVQRGMYDVTNKTYGTFYSVFGNYPVKIAGKTGTAETGRGTENSLFVGYAPADNPQIAVAILIPDNTPDGHSSDTLGPLARAMFDAYFHVQSKPTVQAKKKPTRH
ncbi:hypothetical protein JJB07_10365 [Tumebacillus sp. ITR2]|uniref:Penicillin-binding protein 2 n=1 Tax=Tumebacillus amylolyticus TaxID=2801339 RepID=A0ABS1J9U8_9BACL|nr:penicillin-binding transpeptidase domain-containing protein [Tumebacillus amylolyticus]MBL0387054.1 hypothetical protein [Tumebacillus amylolyticus]